MTAYTKSTNFATKDTLTSGDPLKIVKGTEINTEFDNIATAVNSKSDTASPTFTGTVTIPTLSVSGTAAITGVATLTANPVLSAGTANGVTYLNGSKSLTSGSALTFDGTNFSTTGTASATKLIPTGSSVTGNGLYLPAANALGLSTNGTNAVYIDSSQNVGIGTSAPARPLQVTNNGSASIGLTDTSTGGATLSFNPPQNSNGLGQLDISGANAFRINTNSAERMRIDSSGNLLVGTTSGGGERLYVTQSANASTAYFLNNNGTATNQYGIVVKLNGDPNNTANFMVQCVGNATTRAEIRANGGLANYSANNVNLSDRREKTNFAPSKSYLDVICAIPVQTFNYIDQNLEEDDGLTLGVVAQDVKAVAPELVMESNWAAKDDEPKMRLSIYQTDLQYALMKCIQEQQALITALTARITALENK